MHARRAKGIIAAGHPCTVEAGVELLEEGGNAVDAAVAGAFASMVCEPMLTDIGGGGYMLTASDATQTVYDFFVRAPQMPQTSDSDLDFHEITIDFRGTEQRFHVGLGAAAVPGNIAGLCTAHRREGKLPLERVIEPAIRLAQSGVEVTPAMEVILAVIGPIFLRDPVLARAVSRSGEFLRAGDIMHYSHVLPVLEAVARDGEESFYRGDIAASIVQHCAANGGLITRNDLAGYTPSISRPVKRSVRGHQLLLNGPPSTGGILVAFMLRIVDYALQKSSSKPDITTCLAMTQHICNQARKALLDPMMEEGVHTDPLETQGVIAEYGDRLVEAFQGASLSDRGGLSPPVRGNTTHISVIDRMGNTAAITTSNGEGSGCLVPGVGVHLNNMLGEEDLNPLGFHRVPQGESLPSMMCPMAILHPQGGKTVLGSGGSNRIRSALFQVAYRMLFEEESIGKAVESPRMHVENGVIQAESGLETGALQKMVAQGLHLNQWTTTNLYFGGVHGVSTSADGTMTGRGDDRRGGCCQTLLSEED